MKRTWQIWTDENGDDVVFRGSHTDCLRYYKRHGGSRAGLHIGYEC